MKSKENIKKTGVKKIVKKSTNSKPKKATESKSISKPKVVCKSKSCCAVKSPCKFITTFSSLLNQSFTDFKTLWWRMAVLNISMLFTLLVGACLSILLFVVLLGFGQNLPENSSATGMEIKNMLFVFIAILVGLGAILTWGSKIAKKISVIILGIITIITVGYISFMSDLEGGAAVLENFILNAQYGGFFSPVQIGSLLITLFFFITWIFLFISCTKISGIKIMKNIIDGKKANPIKIFFLESWGYLGKFIALSVRVFFYIFIPLFLYIIAGVLIFFLIGHALQALNIQAESPVLIALNIFTVLYILIFFGILINRSIKMAFSQFYLIGENQVSKEAQNNSEKLVKKNFWTVLISVILIVGIYFVFTFLLNVPDIFKLDISDGVIKVLSLLDFILSFFIFPPIMISFVYRMMNLLSEKK